MTIKGRLLVAAALVACVGLGGASPLGAAPINFADHLQCWKIKDAAARASFTAAVVSNDLGLQEGCVVKVPAKLLCVAAAKSSVAPAPPGAPPGPNVLNSRCLCYKLKCGNAAVDVTAQDQLGGTRTIGVKVGKMLCTPATLS
jgi:hypothetical protein